MLDATTKTPDEQLAEIIQTAESLQSVCQEQKVLIDGVSNRCNALRVERDRFERTCKNLEYQVDLLKAEIEKSKASKTPEKDD